MTTLIIIFIGFKIEKLPIKANETVYRDFLKFQRSKNINRDNIILNQNFIFNNKEILHRSF